MSSVQLGLLVYPTVEQEVPFIFIEHQLWYGWCGGLVRVCHLAKPILGYGLVVHRVRLAMESFCAIVAVACKNPRRAFF